MFYAVDDKGLTEGEGRYGFFNGTIPIHLGANPQSILALEMNGAPLPVEHGASVRLRLETQLGFKMVKWVTGIDFVVDIIDVGQGMGVGERISIFTPTLLESGDDPRPECSGVPSEAPCRLRPGLARRAGEGTQGADQRASTRH